MKKKISISTTVTLVLLTMALTISLTMLLAMRHFNSQLQLVSKRQAMYSHINDVDKAVREHYPDLDEELLRQNIAQGYINGLNDPYAEYYSHQRYEAEKLRMAGLANNIGVVLGERKDAVTGAVEIVVTRVDDGSPASHAIIKEGDVLVSVDSASVEGKTLSELQARIDAAEKISLTVRRGEGESAYLINAAEYDVRSVQSVILDNVGYIKVAAFYENTPEQFKEAVAALSKEGVTGLVFDLRDNAGGSSAAVKDMLSQIMPLGAYGTITDTKGNVSKLSTKVSKTLTLPTVTLINGGTAGEAEFFAGVLQEADLTYVMGETSAGKAKCQEYFVLEQDYSALKLTVGEYGLMKGGSWEGKGIVPATAVVLPPEQAEMYPTLSPNEDAQVQAAVDKLEESVEPPTVEPDPPVDGTTSPSGTGTDGTSTTTTGE
ncbi:MAG: PDZ domain-containing protein [Clostridia bacterium]|nr:PDZ domain-containing protein [Clostridia bacterium]